MYLLAMNSSGGAQESSWGEFGFETNSKEIFTFHQGKSSENLKTLPKTQPPEHHGKAWLACDGAEFKFRQSFPTIPTIVIRPRRGVRCDESAEEKGYSAPSTENPSFHQRRPCVQIDNARPANPLKGIFPRSRRNGTYRPSPKAFDG